MDKENNKSAAGLRRSAIVERLRLREEWSALKGTSNEPNVKKNNKNVFSTRQQNLIISFPKKTSVPSKQITTKNEQSSLAVVSEVLRGTVVLVDVGSEPKALPLRAALTALGASVVPSWSPLVTHVVWSQGGARSVRARARALACALVSPLWVEACAAARRRLPERVFPAPARASDLPSPSTLRRLLKKAEQENISLNFLSDSVESNKGKPARLRISSETDYDTTNTTDTSHDTSADKSRDKSDRTVSPDPEARVNTAARRALPISLSPQRPVKSKRKLFTQREADINTDSESDKEPTPTATKKTQTKLTQRGRRELAHAERLARRLLGAVSGRTGAANVRQQRDRSPRIVLTGMSRKERHEIFETIKQLKGKIQNAVNKRTTHVLMGSCVEPTAEVPMINKQIHPQDRNKTLTMCQNCNTPEDILSQMFLSNVTVQRATDANVGNIVCTCNNISGVRNISYSNIEDNGPRIHHEEGNGTLQNKNTSNRSQVVIEHDNGNILTSLVDNLIKKDKPRTVNALLGAARGCRVLRAQWAIDSARAKRWVHHFGYEVPHLMKISQKARTERTALGKMRSEYAYDIFNGMRVRVSENAEQKDAVNQLLTLCGAITQNKQNGGLVAADFDVTIGRESGDVCSKWVFDSVAAGRMRTTRRYVNKDVPNIIILS